MSREKGVTLIELIIALGLIGVMGITTGSIGISLYSLKREVLDKQEPWIQGHLATSAIFERVLRAAVVSTGPAFTILDNGKTLTYSRAGTTEKIWLDGPNNTIKYYDGASEKVILTNVGSCLFEQDYLNRLAVNIALKSGENFRVAVQPRNHFTPAAIIN
jgi:prepilin-type N-terminal cleavage/methylation domain-containing protein